MRKPFKGKSFSFLIFFYNDLHLDVPSSILADPTISSQIVKVSHFFNTGGGIALYPTINNNYRVASDSYSAVRMTGFPKNSI